MNTFKKITLVLLLIAIGLASFLTLAFYEPWRYLTNTRSSDLILPKDPFTYPLLMIIESPEVDVAKHRVSIHPDLPKLYLNLPSDLPQEVLNYVELRNTYIRQLNDKFLSTPHGNPFELTFKEILPYQYNDKEGFFASVLLRATSGLRLFDASLNEIDRIYISEPSLTHIVSTKFQDRVWSFNYSYGSASRTATGNEVIAHDEIIVNFIDIGSEYFDFTIDPFKRLKIIDKDFDPRIKTHVDYPRGYMLYPLFWIQEIASDHIATKISYAFLYLTYFLKFILRYLFITIITLSLIYLGISLVQKKRNPCPSNIDENCT